MVMPFYLIKIVNQDDQRSEQKNTEEFSQQLARRQS